jgi:uncharacterized protein
MKIDLRKDSHKGKCSGNIIILEERLPMFVNQPIQVEFNYSIQCVNDYYLMQLEEKTSVELICQRCSDLWGYDYSNSHELIVCLNEKKAEKYQAIYDVIVAPDLIVDIKEILLDNMHLFLPEKHEDIDQCNQNQLKLLQNNENVFDK